MNVHEKKTATAIWLEGELEAVLFAHGCNDSVKVTSVGHDGDWTAGVLGLRISDEADRAYIVRLSQLKRDFFFDYGD